MTGDTELGLLFRDPFPEPEPVTTEAAAAPPRASRIRQGFKRRRTVTAVVVVVVLIAAGFGVWAATGSSAATYRWATVTKADVDQTLDSYGTVTPIHQANVTFPVSGTVATVPVKLGQQVKAGQTLASLDISDLQSKLDSAKSTLATAQAKLVSDEDAQATGSTVSATNTSASLGPADTGQPTPLATPSPSGNGVNGGAGGNGGLLGSGGTGGSGGNASSAEAAVTQAQNQLLSDQHKLDQLTSVEATVPSVCGPVIAGLQNTPHVTPSPTASPAGAGGSGGSGGAGGGTPDATACTNLLNTITTDQPLIAAAQSAITSDEAALTAAITKLAASKASSSGGSTGGNTSGESSSRSSSGSSSTSSSGGSGRTGGGGGGGITVTADQLVVDQATVDADTLNAYVDAEALNQANLVSPLAGTVAAINVTPGSSASTSSAAITVIGPGVDQVSTTVTDLDLKDVHVGSVVSVIPDGSNTPVHGTVTAIGLLPVSTSSSSTSSSGRGAATGAASSSSSSTSSTSSTTSSATYPVTISLDTGGLYSGSGADVSIVVKQLSGVTAVPTSAVTTLGTLHTVTVQSGGKAVRRVVVVGASDATFTQITSGLTTGEHVALAQVNLPVPSSGSNTNLARLAGGGGTGRAGFARTGTTGTARTGTTGATRTGG